MSRVADLKNIRFAAISKIMKKFKRSPDNVDNKFKQKRRLWVLIVEILIQVLFPAVRFVNEKVNFKY